MRGSGKVRSSFLLACDSVLIVFCSTGIVPDMYILLLRGWHNPDSSSRSETIGKGLNGGYQALSAVLMSQKIVDGLKSGSGAFANGQTFQCHPAAAVAGLAVMKVFESDGVVENCKLRGQEVRSRSLGLVGEVG